MIPGQRSTRSLPMQARRPYIRCRKTASTGKCNMVFSPSRDLDTLPVTTLLPNGAGYHQHKQQEVHYTTRIPTKKRAIPETYLVLSLIVAFFFNLPLGLIAMCVSFKAKNAYKIGNFKQGECCSMISLCISLFGIFVTACTIIGMILLLLYHADGS